MNKKVPFKSAMQRLEEIVGELEKNDIELEAAIILFEEGLKLIKQCDQQLNGFEQKVEALLTTYQEGE